jgi:iron complex outermembrane receptor protein
MNTLILRSVSAATLLLSMSAAAFAQTSSSDTLTDEIIVTGSPLTRSVDEAITGVSVLTGEELSERLAGTIGETLKYEPGVSSTFFGAGASRPIIRGQGGDRVRVLNNGIGSIDASSASPDKRSVSKCCAARHSCVTAPLAQAVLSM